jgi:iron donor protein CyaY
MTEQDFYELSEETLMSLADNIESKDVNSLLDVEYSDGILTILVERTKQTYVINKHSATQKIWYSSPISGADYFSYDNKSYKWINTKNIDLQNKLFDELSQFISIVK